MFVIVSTTGARVASGGGAALVTARRTANTVFAAVLGFVVAACGSSGGAPVAQPVPVVPVPQPVMEPGGRVEILWDTWGVPHVFAQDEVALFWAFGRAQMESHGDLLLRLYGQARGRAAEYWGEDYLDSDRWVHRNGIPERAAVWYGQQQPHHRAYLDAFAAGINAYAEVNGDLLADDAEVVLPVTAGDVLAHVQRVIHFTFVTDPGSVQAIVRAWMSAPAAPGGTGGGTGEARRYAAGSSIGDERMRGSNGWAIAPSRSASGNAMLLANPHLPWGDLYTWYETHLVLPDMDAYGATLVGFPLPGIAFNAQLGWTHTVNTIDAADLYELTLRDGGYVWEDGTRPLEADTIVLRVRTADGALRGEPLVVQRSVHGPLVAQVGTRALALRVAGLDRPHTFEQNLMMLKARDIGQFEAALSRLQLPMFTVIYADRDGHILHVFNGAVPVRLRGDWRTWNGIVRGDSASTLWTQLHAYGDLPRVVDPPSGWLQNANDPPWTTTFPPTLRPDHFPPYMAPAIALQFRPQRSARMLAEDSLITFDELVRYKHSTYVEAADHVIEDVVIAAGAHGGAAARRAAQVLAAWDRRTEPESRGAILFEAYWREMSRHRWSRGTPFDVPWRPGSPFSTPDGLSDPATAASILEAVATQVESTYGSLDVAWGDVHRLRAGAMDLPANGGPGSIGVFRVVGFARAPDGHRVASSGDSFVAAVEFGEPVRAATLIAYGNATQAHSAHRFDQLPLFARSRLRPVWLSRAEIERHLERRETY